MSASVLKPFFWLGHHSIRSHSKLFIAKFTIFFYMKKCCSEIVKTHKIEISLCGRINEAKIIFFCLHRKKKNQKVNIFSFWMRTIDSIYNKWTNNDMCRCCMAMLSKELMKSPNVAAKFVAAFILSVFAFCVVFL